MHKYDFSKHDKSHYNKYETSYGAIVVAKSFDKVLLAGDGFPKGHAYDGETPTQTAIREVKEETDVDIDEADFILDDAGKPQIFTFEYPWQYGKDVLNLMIEKAIRKQTENSKERPVWNNTKPLTRKIQLFLVPVELDRFKNPKPQLSEVASAKWLTWEDAYKQLSDSKSPSIGLLYEAFEVLKSYKKISKDQELPKPDKTGIKKELERQRKLMCTPLAKWPTLERNSILGKTRDPELRNDKDAVSSDVFAPGRDKTGGLDTAQTQKSRIFPFLIGLVIGICLIMISIMFCYECFPWHIISEKSIKAIPD